MALCAFCKSNETLFYEFGVPICRHCLDITKPSPSRETGMCSGLVHDLTEATVQFEAAFLEFNSIVRDIPSHLPHPDGTQRIQNASRELAAARKKRDCAHSRLDDYLSRRNVPEHLG